MKKVENLDVLSRKQKIKWLRTTNLSRMPLNNRGITMTTLERINKNTYRLKTQKGRTNWLVGYTQSVSYYKAKKYVSITARQLSMTAISFPKHFAGKKIEIHVKIIKSKGEEIK